MKNTNFYVAALVLAASMGAVGQQITGSSVFSPSGGGARILSAQGNTAANPAIGFQSNVSTTITAENDGGGGNGIFRPAPNAMAFATASTERMRITSGGQIGIGVIAPTARLHTFGTVRLESLPSSMVNNMVITTDANGNLAYQPASTLFSTSTAWLLGGNALTNPATDFLGTSDNLDFKIRTNNVFRAIFKNTGEMGIGTATPTAQLDVLSTIGTGIKGKGINVGIYGEATEQNSTLIQRSNEYSDRDGIGVFGNGKYTTHTINGSMYGVVGSATELNPLNNVGVFGEGKNANGYNSGIIGYVNSTTGAFNTGVGGEVKLNTTAQWNRAIAGYAPLAPNHFAGYFEGKVAVVDGTQANNYVFTSDANGTGSWKDPATLLSSSTTAWNVTGNAANPSDFIGTTNGEPFKIHTNGTEKARILTTGEMGIGTASPTAQLEVTSVPSSVQTGIKARGINTGVLGEATNMNAALTEEGIANSWAEAIGVFGKGSYATHNANGNMIGVAGSATANNPLNNNGVWGEAKNAIGYNTGVIGRVNITVGKYNTGVWGEVKHNPTSIWSRAVYGKAPFEPNHHAGYFEGKVEVKDAPLMLSGTVTGFGGPQLLFSDNLSTHPNGKWAIEYVAPITGRPSGGMNFWKPFNTGQGPAKNYSLFLRDDGKVAMGATDDSTDPASAGIFCANALPGNYRLYVNGGILTNSITIAGYCSPGWADYVFANDYKLKPLSEVEAFVKANKHLPNIPSAMDIEKDGLDLGQMQAKQMEKIEELTLYLIEMKKEIEALKSQNELLKNKVLNK